MQPELCEEAGTILGPTDLERDNQLPHLDG